MLHSTFERKHPSKYSIKPPRQRKFKLLSQQRSLSALHRVCRWSCDIDTNCRLKTLQSRYSYLCIQVIIKIIFGTKTREYLNNYQKQKPLLVWALMLTFFVLPNTGIQWYFFFMSKFIAFFCVRCQVTQSVIAVFSQLTCNVDLFVLINYKIIHLECIL